jgi:hypothetical protein
LLKIWHHFFLYRLHPIFALRMKNLINKQYYMVWKDICFWGFRFSRKFAISEKNQCVTFCNYNGKCYFIITDNCLKLTSLAVFYKHFVVWLLNAGKKKQF